MKPTRTCLFLFIIVILGCTKNNRYAINYQIIDTDGIRFYPEAQSEKPDLPSPALTDSEREVVLVRLDENFYSWFDATVENGDTFDYKRGLLGKGNQILADEEDFPAFAKRGIHSEKELANTKAITGRSVSQITMDGRPGGSSGIGFMATDETILSVIWQDNRTVEKLELTHPDLARPLFHLWNISRTHARDNDVKPTEERTNLSALVYNGLEVFVQVTGSRGWQESIFNDEILGTGHIEIWREMNSDELEFLKEHYEYLTPDQFEELKDKISHLHTGELVLFYINRYGFYEGHSDFRPDPVTIAFIFGLRPIEEIHMATDEDLYQYFNKHFTYNPQ